MYVYIGFRHSRWCSPLCVISATHERLAQCVGVAPPRLFGLIMPPRLLVMCNLHFCRSTGLRRDLCHIVCVLLSWGGVGQIAPYVIYCRCPAASRVVLGPVFQRVAFVEGVDSPPGFFTLVLRLVLHTFRCSLYVVDLLAGSLVVFSFVLALIH